MTTLEMVPPVKYRIGSQPILIGKFTDKAGTSTTPTGVRFVIQRDKPGAVAVTYTEASSNVVNTALGRWECTMPTATQHGKFDVHIYGTGGLICADQGSYEVTQDNIE